MASTSIWSPGSDEHVSFSPDCHSWAVTTHDGKMVIWDAETGMAKQEFLPSAHLSTACTCIAWMPVAETDKRKKKSRKRKSSLSLTNGSMNGLLDGDGRPHHSDLVAIGTSSGSVLVYSLKIGDVANHFSSDKAHTDRINDITWNHACTELFTASNDGYVGHFDVRKKSTIARFKWWDGPKSEAAHSVCVHSSDTSLFIGSTAKITWWDLESRTPLKTFTGAHLGAVSCLSIASISTDECYLISSGSSEQDHTIAMWSLNLGKSPSKVAEDNIVARFGANETVRSVTLSTTIEDTLILSAVMRSGTLLCFEYNKSGKSGRKKKPIKPKVTLQVASEKNKSGKVKQIPILEARMLGDEDNMTVKIVRGIYTRPVFETLVYDKLESLTCLVREWAQPLSAQNSIAGSANLLVPKTSNTHVLAAGPSLLDKAGGASTTSTPNGRKRKQSIGDKTETLSMVDRLRLLSRDGESAATPPRADSMLQLLLQGLNNKDRKILDSVLDRADEELIEKTVRKLPVESVLPLVTELNHFIKGRGVVNQSHSKWLRCVLQIHTAYLMSTPECPQILGPIYALLEARTKHYGTLMQLKGKLDMMTRQIVAPQNEETWPKPSKEALLVYQDDSSDELSEVLDDLLLPASDTEDIWQQEDDQTSDEDDVSDDEQQNDDAIEISDDSDEEVVVNGNGTRVNNDNDISMDSDSS